eukprot:5290176-Pleurochrysis_carterae.AAC.2
MIGFTAGFSSRFDAAVESKMFGSILGEQRGGEAAATQAEACWQVDWGLGPCRAEALRTVGSTSKGRQCVAAVEEE